MNWYLNVLKQYAVFSGRARRKEYWMFFLINTIITFVLRFIEGLAGSSGIVAMLYSLAILIPGIAVSVRRLHDTDRSGWWLLIALVPIVGVIVLLVFMVQDSKPGENQYGAKPKTEAAQLSCRCSGCARIYRFGIDAVVVPFFSVAADFLNAPRGPVVESTTPDAPDLVAPVEGTWSSLDPKTRTDQQRTIERLKTLLATRSPRWWKCNACGKVQTY
jgi:uncharacterized membrane protein YhaH (DUF805 family)